MIKDQWVKSKRCDNSGPNCVEVLATGDGVQVRNSTAPGQTVSYSNGEWDVMPARWGAAWVWGLDQTGRGVQVYVSAPG